MQNIVALQDQILLLPFSVLASCRSPLSLVVVWRSEIEKAHCVAMRNAIQIPHGQNFGNAIMVLRVFLNGR